MLGERVAEVPREGGLVTDPTAEPVTLLDFDGETDIDVVAVLELDGDLGVLDGELAPVEVALCPGDAVVEAVPENEMPACV